MAVQRTFSILKPDVTRRNLTGAVNQRIEAAGLRIVAQKRVQMTRAQAETFYGVHRERPFFGELVEMMTAAPVVVQVLEGEDAIQRYRDVMGATNPEKAEPGTIRKDFALSMGENSVHGSDAPETAAQEIAQWFAGNEIVGLTPLRPACRTIRPFVRPRTHAAHLSGRRDFFMNFRGATASGPRVRRMPAYWLRHWSYSASTHPGEQERVHDGLTLGRQRLDHPKPVHDLARTEFPPDHLRRSADSGPRRTYARSRLSGTSPAD